MRPLFFAALSAALLTSCYHSIDDHFPEAGKMVTLDCQTITADKLPTRATLTDEQLTDLWVFDGSTELVHQTSSDTDFGTPSVLLPYGQHNLHVVATRIANATIADGILSGDNPRATFAKHLALDVDRMTANSQAVQLTRQTYQLSITADDTWPATFGHLEVKIEPEYVRYNVLTGEGVTAATPTIHTITPPASWAGTTECTYSVHGFAPDDDEFTAAVTWTLYAADNTTVLQQHFVDDVPLQKNYLTTIHGKFFGSSYGWSVSLNNQWAGQKEVTF